MTDSFIRSLVELLAGRLTVPTITADDFVRLASAGEPARRAISLLETVPTAVAQLLASYEEVLAAYDGPMPLALDEDAAAVAAELVAYRGIDDEDGDAALSLILELDAIVSTVVAAERAKRLLHGTAEGLAALLEQMLANVSHQAPHLAQLAEDRWLTVGDDPELMVAYGWLDVLSEAAPSRVRIKAVVRDAAARERRIEETLRSLLHAAD